MKRIFGILPLFGFSLVASALDNEPVLVAAQELHARRGLPNFLAKASKPGTEMRVAYLGGSITAQPGWRVKSLNFLKTTFPEVTFSEINAALGGTGSDLGVFRVGPEVLEQKPDLLFVEFAVNDGGAAPEQITRSMEGIVRKTWRAFPECDVCFVYTVTEALVEPMLEGKFPRAASTMERVADRYGIPTIHMGMEVARLAREGKLLWKAKLPVDADEKARIGDKFVFAPDSVHPHPETGHELYLRAIERSFPGIRSASAGAQPHILPEPLMADNYERARLLPVSEAQLSAGFKPLDPAKDELAKRFPRLKALHSAVLPGETLCFKFKGTRASIYQVIGPDVGKVMITLDDQPPKTVTLFDPYCRSHRLSTLFVGSELPDTAHTVKIQTLSEPPDKASILAKKEQKIENPETYKGTSFHPGGILLVGELLK